MLLQPICDEKSLTQCINSTELIQQSNIKSSCNQSKKWLKPDFEQAKRFLKILDPNAKKYCYFVFTDSKEAGAKKIAKTLYGRFDELKHELATYNNQGLAIAVNTAQ